MSEEHQPEPIHDPPIEHDDLGQALLTLPFAVAEGAKDVAEWAVSETIIPVAEHIIDAFKPSEAETAEAEMRLQAMQHALEQISPAFKPLEEPTAAQIDLPETEETSTHATYVSHEDAP